jgi:hypothetical protein
LWTGNQIPNIAAHVLWEVLPTKHSGIYHVWYHVFVYNITYDIIHEMQVQGRKIYAGKANKTSYHHFTGKESLNMHLLKPALLDVPPGQPNVMCADAMHCRQPVLAWLDYLFWKSHLILSWLP